MSIFAGVAIHQIPVSLSISSMLQESALSRKTQILLVLLFAFAAPIGFILSDRIIDHISVSHVSLATALA